MYAIDSVHSFLSTDEDYPTKYILAILNSKVIDYVYHLLISETGKVFPQVKLTIVRKLPIPNASESSKSKLIQLVDNILDNKKANPLADTSDKEREIDQLVYQLYGLSEEDIKIVEETY